MNDPNTELVISDIFTNCFIPDYDFDIKNDHTFKALQLAAIREFEGFVKFDIRSCKSNKIKVESFYDWWIVAIFSNKDYAILAKLAL